MESNEREPLRRIDEPPIDEPPPDDEPPPPRITVRINQISPIAGALTGGITVTLTGAGFQSGAEVFFGDSPSPEVVIESPLRAQAKLPAASQTGSVDVSLFNPDGSSARLTGGFTYVVTGTGAQAEVLGVTPLAVIEDTESEVTIRGRNLVEAYTNGMLALRGPTRAQVAISNHTSSRDEATGIEELTFTLRVTAAPPLDPLERMAIQVLASRRPGAASDGVFESSRQMFTVLPRSRPVPLAYSANLDPGKPNLVVIAGRNLEGCTLGLGDGATVHLQRSNDRFVAGIVTISEEMAAKASPQLSVRNTGGDEVAQYAMWIAPDATTAAAPAGEVTASVAAEPAAGDINLTLTPVPGQQMVAPTEQDSTVFNLNSASSSSLFFDWFNFEITILDLTIVLPIVHEVHLIPFFDGVSADELSDSPVLAQVGRLLRLRGVGLLVALHVDVFIHIRVVLIIGFRFEIWGFGLFNEFPEFGWAIGSIVIGIRIEIEIIFILAFLLAAVLPQGRLRVIFSFNLVAGLHFTITTDGRRLKFGSDFHVEYGRVGPTLNNLLPCGGHFQLASENGQTVFPDAFGGHQSFYFPRAEGECCVPWDFSLELVRTDPDGSRETVQTSFRADYCLNAAPGQQLGQIIITSENPSPTGFPPTLVMEVEQLALLRALSAPVDASGNPTGEPPQDVRDLGYDVEFFLESPVEVVLDPGSLTLGHAFAIQTGDNVIHARLIPRAAETPRLAFWPPSVLGFAIAGPLAEGREPGVIAGALPVVVKGRITVTPTLIYRVEQGRTSVKVEAPPLFHLNNVPVREVERSEPFNNPRRYVLGLKINADPGTQPATLRFRVKTVRMEVLPLNTATPQSEAPLDIQELTDSGIMFDDDRRTSTDAGRFFIGKLSQEAQQFTLRVDPNVGDPVEVLDSSGKDGLILTPNHKEAPGSPRKLVPPGQNVAGRHVLLTIELEITSSDVQVVVTQSTIRLAVTNEETFEEYLRVLVEPDSLVASSPRLSGFAASFEARLSKGHSDTLLNGQGALLWEEACAEMQTSFLDDRPLYWTRLRCTAVLRAYFKRQSMPGAERERLIKQFEWPSRGLDADGVIRFADPQAAGSRRAIVTGFDPFFLPSQPDRSNPSGVSALSLNKRTLNPYKALFIKRDVATQGTWRGAYGADGYNVINDAVNYPSYAQVTTAGQSSHTWAPSTAEARALQKASSTDRLAACWFGAQFTVEVNITDGKAHQVELYVLDWDGNNGRSQTIEVLDAATNEVLDSRSVSAFSDGQYLVWEVSGHVKFRVTNNAGPALNAVLSGIFFSTPRTNPGVFVRTAIFPVRYEDFNKNMVENSVRPTLGSIVMLMTCSQGLDGFYYVDRFPARRRGNKKFNPQDPNDPQAGPPLIDNNRALERDTIVPPNLAPGDEYLESTLPYELEIKSDPATRQLPAPQPGPPFAQNFFFFLNQSYWILGSRATTTVPGERRLDPQDLNDDSSFNKKERPRAGATAYEGSGGNYLSNEIFYRTALTRTREAPSLASGHFHIPPLRTSPRSLGPGLVHSVRTAAERFLKHLFRTRKSGDITFPRTNVNTTSAPITLTAANVTNETISVFTVDVAPPFAVQWPGPTPIPLSPGSSLPLPFTFRPTTPGVHTQTVKLRDGNGELLLLATLTGEAVPTYSVTGQVTVGGMPLQGVQVTLSGSRTASVSTGKDGRYSFTNLDAGGNYTITPSKANYTFTPPSRSFSGLAANQTADFTATHNRRRIRGRVRTASGVAIPNAIVMLYWQGRPNPEGDSTIETLVGMMETNATGEYLFADLKEGDTYTVTISRGNYTFTPEVQVFVLDVDVDFDITGTPVSYRISGHVGLGGVTVNLSGSQTAAATTDTSGNYSFSVTAEGNYTVTPSKTHYTFTPPSLSFNNLGGDRMADFAATLHRHRISGRVIRDDGSALAGATLALAGTRAATTVSDDNGAYSFADLPAGGSYTVTVSRANYSFAQPSRTFNDLASTQTADFTGVLLNYTVSGRVTSGGSALSGVAVTLSGSQSATATTDASGNYSFTVTAEGNYTVTPSKQHYTFAPQLISFNNLGGNQTADFSATLNRHAISGRVTTAGGGALPNVTLSLSGSQSGTATSDAAANYSFAGLPAGGTYTVTAARANYAFTPASKSFSALGANQTADFTGGLVSYRISGRVMSDDAGLAGVTINLSGSRSATATTDASGHYSFTVPAEGSYIVTASKTHYTFAPPSLSFNNLGGDQAADFAATLNRHAISGRVADVNNKGIAGVTVALSGTQPRTATTDTAGNYSFTDLPAGGSYTVTASKANYTFTPPSQSFNDLATGQSANFAATLVSYRIGGRVTENGAGLGGVTVTLSGSRSATATTDVGGNYSFTVPAEGSYTITPSKTNYTFSPPSATFSNLGANQSADFSAALNRYTISGSIMTADGGALPNVTVSLAGSQSDTATTDASGHYAFANLPAGGSYTITPSRANYTFTPATLSFSNLGANHAADFRAALVRYTVSGKVMLDGEGLGGVTVTLTGSETATATTDASGNYSFTVPAEGSYTVTQSKQHYTFTPQPIIFNNLGANQTANFASTLNRHTISGRVTGGGAGLGGVTVHLSGSQTGTVITDATGDYSFVDLPAGGDYTVTPSRANYTYSPASRSFGDLGATQTADFTGTPVSYTVSGRVASGGSGLAGVTINLGGSLDAAAATDASGDYSFTVTAEGSYAVTPSEPHYTFTPPAASFSNLGADQRADFNATLNHHTISGRIAKADGAGIAGVAVTLSGTRTGATTTDAAGNYSFTGLPAGGGYTVTAARTNYTFTPALSFSDLIANQTADFTGTPVSYTISGRVASGGIGLAYITVTLAGSERATATTDASGNYSFSVPAEGSYTVSPSEHYAFTPPSATFDSLTANQTADFGAPPDRHRISGRVTSPAGDALPNVLLSLTGSQLRTTRTDEAGDYSFANLPEGGNYTVTPKLFGYSFTPLSRTLNGLSADQAGDFAAGPVGGVRINLALPSDGPVFSVSTMYRLSRTPSAVINGDLRGIHWHDAAPDGSPAWLEVSFARQKTISEVHVFNIQENLAAIAELAEATTFTQHGLQDFGVEYWAGTEWQSVPGGAITNNSRVWVKIAFPPLTTTKIRLVVRRAPGG